MPHDRIKAGVVTLAIGLFAALTPANAAPQVALGGLNSTALPIEQVGYRHGHHYFYSSYPEDYAYSSDGYQSYQGYSYRSGESDEIRELRRAFPSTNWPPSDRY
jgi:hypothetical protein